MRLPKVKVCGMRDADNIKAIAALRPDFMGFIYYPRSPRHFGDMPCDVVRSLPEGIMDVLVTVDLPETQLMELVHKYGFHSVQLHGSEDAEVCRRLRRHGLNVIKALPMSDSSSIDKIKEYDGSADLLVLDTATSGKGGSGKKFDWSILADADITTNFLLSGGIAPDDVEALAEFNHPRCIGVDINSRFESSPGIKSVPLVHEFITKIRQ